MVEKGSLQDEGGDVNREIARKQKATCASCENKQFQIYVPAAALLVLICY